MIPGLTIQTRGLSKNGLTQKVRDELYVIAKACDNHLTPEIVLLNARQETSPIHHCFEWDNTQAAEKFRYIQAAMLIRTVNVLVETHPQDEPKMVRAFVSVVRHLPEKGNGDQNESDESQSIRAYVPIEVALNSDTYRSQMLENAFRELRSFQRKYAVLKELAAIIEQIEKLAIPA